MSRPSVIEVSQAIANVTLDTMAGIVWLMIAGSAVKTGVNVFQTGEMVADGASLADSAAHFSEGVAYATQIAFDALALKGIGALRNYLNSSPTPPNQV